MKSFFRASLAVILSFILFHVFYTLITLLVAFLAVLLPFIEKLLLFFDGSNLLFHIPFIIMAFAAMYFPAVTFRAVARKCPNIVTKWASRIFCIVVCLSIFFFYSSDILERIACCLAACGTFKVISNT